MKIPGKRSEFFASARRKVLHDKILVYLAKTRPTEVFDRPQDALSPVIMASIDLGERLGLRKVSGHKRLAYLYVLSEGRIAQTPEALNFIRFGGTDPDSQTSELIRHTAAAVQSGDVFRESL